MMLFQRRIFGELTKNALTAFLLLLVVLLLVTSARIVHRVEGLSLLVFMKSVPVFTATALDLLLPVAVLVGVVLTYGRATADNEVNALRACGIHPLHLFTPGMVFGALMMVTLLGVMDWGMPMAKRAQRRIAKSANLASLLENKLSAEEPVSIDEHTVISANSIGEDGQLLGIRLQLFGEKLDLNQEIVAESSELLVDEGAGEFQLILHDWRRVKGAPGSGSELRVEFPIPHDLADLRIEHLTTPQLMAWLMAGEPAHPELELNRLLGTLHLRLALSTSCLLFVLLGIPVALLFRRYDRVGAYLIAFLVALFIYYPSMRISKALLRKEILSPELASWTGSALLLLLGIILTVRVVRR